MLALRCALLAAVGSLLIGPAAALGNPVKQYVLAQPGHEHCRAHYTRWVTTVKKRAHGRTVKVRETVCVHGKPKAALTAHLDPTFTQDPANPLAVTYSFSASAIETLSGVPSRPARLPRGVLDLYSDGLLKCSINVGGSVAGGSCQIVYQTFGAHTVIVTYISGSTSATQTSAEQIKPFSTTTTLKLSGPTNCTGSGAPAEPESCTYVGEVATLDQNGNVPVKGSESLTLKIEPEQEFLPGISTAELDEGRVAFPGPVTFTIEREQSEGGWLCSLRHMNTIEWFGGIVKIPSRGQCGMSVSAYGDFSDVENYRETPKWTSSMSESVPIHF